MSQEKIRNLEYYCNAFSKLKVYKNRERGGKSLNKPVLLLSIIDLIAQDLIETNHITISDRLVETFQKYWNILDTQPFKSSDFALPFFHLNNEQGEFWNLKYSETYRGGRPQTIPKLKNDVDFALIDDSLFAFIKNPISRQELIDILISVWFSASKRKLEEILLINQNFHDCIQNEIESKEEKAKEHPGFYFKKSNIRDSFFRKAIVYLYDYHCAFCRLRVIHSINQSIVDGAHIKTFSEFYDSTIDNGISLCKNHHWAFDAGLFTIDKDYKIIVSKKFEEQSPNARPIKNFHGELILLPTLKKSYPRIEALEWHQQNKFKS